jgi:hypothetical protein
MVQTHISVATNRSDCCITVFKAIPESLRSFEQLFGSTELQWLNSGLIPQR